MKKLISLFALLTLMASYSQAHAFTDGQVSEVLKTRNSGEIVFARHVISNGSSAEVRKFAQEMLDDHTLNNEKINEILKAASLKPETSSKIAEVRSDLMVSQKKLFPLKGKELDIAYLDEQIRTHGGIVEGIKANLVPAAKNPALKIHLDVSARVNEMHLEQAKALRATLK